jgi:hypothetical protein
MFGPLYTVIEQTDGFWMPFCLNYRNKAYVVNVSDIGTEFYIDWRL